MKSIRSNLGSLAVIAGFIVLLIFIHFQLRAQTQAMSLATFALDGSGRGNDLPAYAFSTKGLWLEITSVSNGLVSLNLHNATNEVYEVWSKIDILVTNWNIERDVWPGTNPAIVPFTVPKLDRTNLFIWARDWTGVDENSNGIPDWWEYEHPGGLLPMITAQPANQTVVQGNDVIFSVGVSASNTPPLSYKWYFNNITPLAGATNATLMLGNVQTNNSGDYSVIVTNKAGSATSTVTCGNGAQKTMIMRIGHWATQTGIQNWRQSTLIFIMGNCPI